MLGAEEAGPSVRTRRQRNADVKLMLGATVAVLLAGLVIGAGIFVAADSGGDRVSCGRLPVGSADAVREEVERGPAFQTGGGSCGFWLALDEGDIVAYRVEQPSGCALKYERDHFECGGERVDAADLTQYPVSIETRDGTDTLIVDLANTEGSTASSSSTTEP
jgi:hypothetical protein